MSNFDRSRRHTIAADSLQRTYGPSDRAVCGHRRMARWAFALAWADALVIAAVFIGVFCGVLWAVMEVTR